MHLLDVWVNKKRNNRFCIPKKKFCNQIYLWPFAFSELVLYSHFASIYFNNIFQSHNLRTRFTEVLFPPYIYGCVWFVGVAKFFFGLQKSTFGLNFVEIDEKIKFYTKYSSILLTINHTYGTYKLVKPDTLYSLILYYYFDRMFKMFLTTLNSWKQCWLWVYLGENG